MEGKWEIIDRKFNILAVNPCNGHIYTEADALLLCAKDKAVPAALNAYYHACIDLGCDDNHLISIRLLIDRVRRFQKEIESRIPDTVGAEIQRCLHGVEAT